VSQVVGPNVGVWVAGSTGTGSTVLGAPSINGVPLQAGLLTDTGTGDTFGVTTIGSVNKITLGEFPITAKNILAKDITKTHWSGIFLGTEDGVNFIEIFFNT